MGKGRNAGGGSGRADQGRRVRESLTLKCGLAYVTTLLITSPKERSQNMLQEKSLSARAAVTGTGSTLPGTWINELKSKMTLFLKK